jgi:hypothetical protein
MAVRHYDLDVRIVEIKDGGDYEAALFNGAAQHLRDRYHRIPRRKKIEPSHALGASLSKTWMTRVLIDDLAKRTEG